MTIGIVVAHPDDECLGPGGTLVKLVQSGEQVALLVLGDGTTSRLEAGALQIRKRADDMRRALVVLRIREVECRGLKDNAFDAVGILTVAQSIEPWLRRVRPIIVYTHSGADLNVDHRLTCQAVLTATRPQPGQAVREVYAFETPSSTEWAFGQFGAFQPNVFIDITETIDAKLKALACYESEVRPYPHPRSPEAIRAIARRWGSVAGVPYAEAFQLIRSLR